MATMTLIGLYNYDNSIFDKIALPEVLDKETVINAILFNCSEFEPLYPAPDAIKDAIGYWSASKKHGWDKIAYALYREYNPFINFTRDERRETNYTPNLLKTRTANLKDTQTLNTQEAQQVDETATRRPDLTTTTNNSADTTATPNLTTEHRTAAWNESALQTATSDVQTGTSRSVDNSSGTSHETGTDTNTRRGSDSKRTTGTNETATSGTDTYSDTGNAKTVETFHSEGDSAMYTPTDVARKETELRIAFDMIDIIIDSFKTNIVLAIY